MEFYKPVKTNIDKDKAFQLGWTQQEWQDSVIYAEELTRIKLYYYNDNGDLQRIEKIDTSYLFLDLIQRVPPAVNRHK